ncbi:MAG: hypothetical protein HY423_07895 [Candidatus Lambdaproteobacteria bacterium]|nr:hypothetical protein [Candidatus Lambdaproteobacteria bacterium]
MSGEALLALALGAVLAGGAAALLPAPGERPQRIAVGLTTLGAALGLAAAASVLAYGPSAGLRLGWALPGAELRLQIDALSAWFLVPIFLVSGLGAWYGLDSWRLSEHPASARRLLGFYALATAAMAIVVTARNGILFLAAWEVMTVSAFMLVTTEDERQEVREAGWIYFIAAHASTLLLFGLLGLLWRARGSFDLEPFAAGALSPALASGMFLLALGGFGIKAGLFPVHVWLPPAHANAPSHVSALLSGVLIKMGVYGMVRVTWLFGDPPLWWGALLLALGVVSGVLGVAFALGQHDLKRLLAYHSIENIGIIFIGLGLAVGGRAAGSPALVALGLGGALLHTWNHGLFKTLLFFGAGAVLHRTHTREIDQLGGLAKAMPRTALYFLVGAAAICGLPPLNGFVSELFVYLGLFGSLGAAAPLRWLPAVLAIPALALIGALAVACFVKVCGAVFLGEPRTDHARHARECGPAMVFPMAVLAACCVGIGLFPALVVPALDRATAGWSLAGATVPLAGLAPLAALTWTGAALLAGGGLLALALRAAGLDTRLGTWDCGYVLPTPRMQYTGSSFAQVLVTLWRTVLIPAVTRGTSDQLFPGPSHYATRVPDTVLERALLPGLRGIAWLLAWLRPLQRGSIHAYLFYVFLTLLILLLFK